MTQERFAASRVNVLQTHVGGAAVLPDAVPTGYLSVSLTSLSLVSFPVRGVQHWPLSYSVEVELNKGHKVTVCQPFRSTCLRARLPPVALLPSVASVSHLPPLPPTPAPLRHSLLAARPPLPGSPSRRHPRGHHRDTAACGDDQVYIFSLTLS